MTTSAPTSRCATAPPERVTSGRGAALWLLLGALAAGPAGADCRDLAAPRAVPTAAEGQWNLATFNLWRLRDTEKNSPIDRPLDDAFLRRHCGRCVTAVEKMAAWVVGEATPQ